MHPNQASAQAISFDSLSNTLVISGYTDQTTIGAFNMAVAKFDTDGGRKWMSLSVPSDTQDASVALQTLGFGVSVAYDGNIYATGSVSG